MIAATTIFFEPDWPRRLLRRPSAGTSREAPSPLHGAALGALALWASIQILVPLRHVLYPGEPNWTEEGHTFAWHMKLRNKSGDVKFYVVREETGRRQQMHHDLILTDRQRDKMATRPYMIQQFARYIAEELEARGHTGYEVRVDALVSLNGRPKQRMIDPEVDLGAEPRSLWPAEWIVPLHTPLEPTRSRGASLEVE